MSARRASRRDATVATRRPGSPLPLEMTMRRTTDPEQALVAAATLARTRAQAHYSGFKVGAALETATASRHRLQHRERDLRADAVRRARRARQSALRRHTVFTRIAVVADTESPTPPCGPCRQLLWEYCGDIERHPRQPGSDYGDAPAVGAAAAALRREAARGTQQLRLPNLSRERPIGRRHLADSLKPGIAS